MLRRAAGMLVAALVIALLGPIGPSRTGPAQAAAPSPPGSIVYIKDHNVWLMKGDGSAKYQVTLDGTASNPYWSPTQSNGGIVVAVRGPDLVRMKQNGQVLNRITPPAIENSAGQPMSGFPTSAAISPDGSKIVYSRSAYMCPIGVSCMMRSVTGITASTGVTATSTYGTSYFRRPSWIGNARTLQHGGYGSHMMLQNVGQSTATHWFDDSDVFDTSTDLGDGEVSRDGKFLTAVRDYGSNAYVVWFALPQNPTTGSPALPAPRCRASADEGSEDPTWAPDSSSLAYQSTAGIMVITGVNKPACEDADDRLIAPGGQNPHWSPAANKPPARTTPKPPATAPKTFSVSTPAISGTAKVGRTLTAKIKTWSPAASSYSYQWKRDGKAIKKATKATYKLTRTDRKKTIKVKVTAKKKGVPSATTYSKPTKKIR